MQLPSNTKKPRDQSQNEDDHNASGKRGKKGEKEAEMSNPNEQEENEGYIEDDGAEEVVGDQMYDQNEYYYDEDNNDFFDDY